MNRAGWNVDGIFFLSTTQRSETMPHTQQVKFDRYRAILQGPEPRQVHAPGVWVLYQFFGNLETVSDEQAMLFAFRPDNGLRANQATIADFSGSVVFGFRMIIQKS